MFNNIGPFISKIDRKTEQSDTHQNVLRQNPDEQRRKKQDKRAPETEQADLASVSIDSLYLFLQSALPEDKTNAFETAAHKAPDLKPQDSRTSKAMDAYQKRAGQEAPPPRHEQRASKDLSPQEINTIQNLMAELKSLKQKGMQPTF